LGPVVAPRWVGIVPGIGGSIVLSLNRVSQKIVVENIVEARGCSIETYAIAGQIIAKNIVLRGRQQADSDSVVREIVVLHSVVP
jgi:hypothetical protein